MQRLRAPQPEQRRESWLTVFDVGSFTFPQELLEHGIAEIRNILAVGQIRISPSNAQWEAERLNAEWSAQRLRTSYNPNDTLDALRYTWSQCVWPETSTSASAWQTIVHEQGRHIEREQLHSLTDPPMEDK